MVLDLVGRHVPFVQVVDGGQHVGLHALEPLVDAEDVDFLRVAIMKHLTYTGSRYAESLLADFAAVRRRVIKVMPREYKRALADQAARREAERTSVVERLVVTGVVASAASGAETSVHG